MSYLFVHFREKLTPDGEQVYFSVSKDGLNWEKVNNGSPVLTSELGEKGCRDIEIIRTLEGKFVIIATDLCVANRLNDNNQVNWQDVNHNGSKKISIWFSDDLINFSEQRQIDFTEYNFGCLWAPEIFYDDINCDYVIHWGSTVKTDDYNHMSIYYCVTKDFISFSKPELFFNKENEILDSHLVKVNNTYHLFYKNAEKPAMNMHATSDNLFGPYKHDYDFEKLMSNLEKPGSYEAPTTFTLPDGRWCLMLDYFGCEREKMGYVPFVSEKPGDTNFKMAKEEFYFPYGFKHGKVIKITDQEYTRIKEYFN